MNTRNFIAVLATMSLLSTSTGLLASDALPHLFVPDGQLLSRPIQVYVSSTNLDEDMNPFLMLIGFDSSQHSGSSSTNIWKPFFVASGQSWTENVSGQTVSRQGSFLLFDLKEYQLAAYKSTARVTPILTWNGAGAHDSASSTTVVGSPVYLGKSWVAAGWTILVVGVLLAVIYILCHVKSSERKR